MIYLIRPAVCLTFKHFRLKWPGPVERTRTFITTAKAKEGKRKLQKKKKKVKKRRKTFVGAILKTNISFLRWPAGRWGRFI